MVISVDIAQTLKAQGIAPEAHVHALDCPGLLPILDRIVGADRRSVPKTVDELIKSARSRRISAIVCGSGSVFGLMDGLLASNLQIGVLAFLEANGNSRSSAADLRTAGVMDLITSKDEAAVALAIRRALEYRALVVLELAHRCESRRLTNRELELLGQPPESMSDDLQTYQPPPLPVGPLSVYNLEEASDAFEKAYIDRVQRLCGSAREAALYLGVSSATLSRRLRKETVLDGT